MEGYKFIAGAICPSCKEQDSIVLKDDDSEVKCISCNYFELRDCLLYTSDAADE